MWIFTLWNIILFMAYSFVICSAYNKKSLIILELTTTITYILFYTLLLSKFGQIMWPILVNSGRMLPEPTIIFIDISNSEFYLFLFFLLLLIFSPSSPDILCYYLNEKGINLNYIIQKYCKWLFPFVWIILWAIITLAVLPFVQMIVWIKISCIIVIPFGVCLIIRWKIRQKLMLEYKH